MPEYIWDPIKCQVNESKERNISGKEHSKCQASDTSLELKAQETESTGKGQRRGAGQQRTELAPSKLAETKMISVNHHIQSI